MGATSAPREIPFRGSIARAVLHGEGEREGGIRMSSSPTLLKAARELSQPPGELKDLLVHTQGRASFLQQCEENRQKSGFLWTTWESRGEDMSLKPRWWVLPQGSHWSM